MQSTRKATLLCISQSNGVRLSTLRHPQTPTATPMYPDCPSTFARHVLHKVTNEAHESRQTIGRAVFCAWLIVPPKVGTIHHAQNECFQSPPTTPMLLVDAEPLLPSPPRAPLLCTALRSTKTPRATPTHHPSYLWMLNPCCHHLRALLFCALQIHPATIIVIYYRER